MSSARRCAQIAATWLAVVFAAQAQPASDAAAGPAGIVKRAVGTVSLDRGGARQALAQGAEVRVGDTLRTGADGALGVTLADDTLLAVGANSELVISNYSFNATTQEGGMLASLWKGTLGVVTGLIGRKAPEKVRVQTRTVVLGVRGTEFIVDTTGAAK